MQLRPLSFGIQASREVTGFYPSSLMLQRLVKRAEILYPPCCWYGRKLCSSLPLKKDTRDGAIEEHEKTSRVLIHFPNVSTETRFCCSLTIWGWRRQICKAGQGRPGFTGRGLKPSDLWTSPLTLPFYV